MIPKLDDYHYSLPPELIAQEPVNPRDHSKLLQIDRQTNKISHHVFYQLSDLLKPGDVLVLNDTKVIPARLNGLKLPSKNIELLLLKYIKPCVWRCICRPGLKPDDNLDIQGLRAKVISLDKLAGQVDVEFDTDEQGLKEFIDKHGHTPIPPYIHSQSPEEYLRERYQTIFAQTPGSAAAPTAGLHFTNQLLAQLKAKGIHIEHITLHVGPGTFQRLREENLETNKLHRESIYINQSTANRLIEAKLNNQRIIAVGTTTTRTLEACVETNNKNLELKSGWRETQLFIHPPYEFKFVDAMITNFHLPESSLLMLIAAFTTYPQTPEKFSRFNQSLIGQAYQQAIDANYRFFSFGDAMLIT